MAPEGRSADLTPDNITYYVDRSSNACMLLIWSFAIACGVLLLAADRTVGWVVIGIFSALALAKIIDLLPGSMRLFLNRDGFVSRRFYHSQMVGWDEIAEPFTRQGGPQLVVGYLCSFPYRKYALLRWYHRALWGMDGWIVPWKFRARPLSISGAMHLFWRRAQADLKLRHWQPDRLVFEGSNIFAPFLIVLIGWLTYYALSVLIKQGSLSSRGWLFLLFGSLAVISFPLSLVPGAFRLTLTLEGFEQRWLWRRHFVRWRNIEKPIAQGNLYKAIFCEFNRNSKATKKVGWLDYVRDTGRYVNDNGIRIPQHLMQGMSRRLLLQFMIDFWQRAQTDATPLDLPGSKD